MTNVGLHDRINRILLWDVNVRELDRSIAFYEELTSLRATPPVLDANAGVLLEGCGGTARTTLLENGNRAAPWPTLRLVQWIDPAPVGAPSSEPPVSAEEPPEATGPHAVASARAATPTSPAESRFVATVGVPFDRSAGSGTACRTDVMEGCRGVDRVNVGRRDLEPRGNIATLRSKTASTVSHRCDRRYGERDERGLAP